MPNSYSLPALMEDEIEALIDAGYYSSKSDVVKDAIREMLEKNKNMLMAAAIEMYKGGKVSIGRAAEIARTSLPDFKEALKERGIKIVLGHDKKMMKSADRIMKKMR
ncbi:MAG: UPF0175 family protein [Candidatus Aenigmarchaeota archaeon]|nr:UPF0175 family protein [Candidatus Aenigmarchaeota archaeon]